MNQDSALMTIRERNKRKRLVGWILIYMLLVTGLGFIIYWQASRVNTLGFASGQLQLTTSKTKYTVGDTVSYTLKNDLNQPLTFTNTCPQEPLYVYSWNNISWVRIHDTASAAACASEPKQQTIPAGGSYTQNFSKWPKTFNKPGIYRLVVLATNYTALPYTDFQVVAKPVKPKIQTQIQVIIQKVITPIYITVPSNGGGDN